MSRNWCQSLSWIERRIFTYSGFGETLALRVLVIGCGHVGLVTGGCLSAIGHHVICADRDTQLIDSLERGDVPFYEPHLDRLIQRNVKAGRLVFTSDVSASAT